MAHLPTQQCGKWHTYRHNSVAKHRHNSAAQQRHNSAAQHLFSQFWCVLPSLLRSPPQHGDGRWTAPRHPPPDHIWSSLTGAPPVKGWARHKEAAGDWGAGWRGVQHRWGDPVEVYCLVYMLQNKFNKTIPHFLA